MIIDSHTHWGKSVWGDFSPEYLMDVINEDVDIAICSNLEGIESSTFKWEEECNMKMLEVVKKCPKLKPLYVCQPNYTEDVKIAKMLLEK